MLENPNLRLLYKNKKSYYGGSDDLTVSVYSVLVAVLGEKLSWIVGEHLLPQEVSRCVIRVPRRRKILEHTLQMIRQHVAEIGGHRLSPEEVMIQRRVGINASVGI